MRLAAGILFLLDISNLDNDVLPRAGLDPKLSEAIVRVRRSWFRKPFPKSVASILVRNAFEPLETGFIHVAPRFVVADRLENDCGEEFEKFKGLGRFGGKRDLLTQPVVNALRKNRGVVFLTLESDDYVSDTPTEHLLFTLDSGKQCGRYGFIYVRLK